MGNGVCGGECLLGGVVARVLDGGDLLIVWLLVVGVVININGGLKIIFIEEFNGEAEHVGVKAEGMVGIESLWLRGWLAEGVQRIEGLMGFGVRGWWKSCGLEKEEVDECNWG